jgi:hypothetical protein
MKQTTRPRQQLFAFPEVRIERIVIAEATTRELVQALGDLLLEALGKDETEENGDERQDHA